MTDCYDRASGSGAYSLGALSAEEAAEFEGALRESAELRHEVDGFTETAAQLALAVPPVPPSPGLKASILAAIEGTQSEAAPAPESERTAREADLADGRHVARARRPSTARSRALLALAAAAAAVLLFAGGALAGGLITSVSAERTADRFAALNAAPDVVRTITPLPDGGSIAFVGSAELGMSAVVLHEAELPKGSTFQAWYVEESGPESAGVVQPASSGYTMLEGRYEGERVAMTIEPEGGSDEPTTEPMVLTDGQES
jgi:anti-sigma-K factor RskA